ncbi:hypothetical protein JXB28_01680 [Candidatus Woesearchaeota archaeon]|nr:hypothetical protein [Candidatus Woesearchaeota archaeon]
MGRGQVWSVDVLLAVVIFVSVILVFYVTMTAKQKQGLTDLESEATDLKVALEMDRDFGFLSSDTIDEEKLLAFIGNATNNYTGLKNKLGVKGDFCVFYEDSEGRVIVVDNKPGIGDSSVLIDGHPCGVDLT